MDISSVIRTGYPSFRRKPESPRCAGEPRFGDASFRRKPESILPPNDCRRPYPSFRRKPESILAPNDCRRPYPSFRRKPESTLAPSVPRRRHPNFTKSPEIMTATGLTPPNRRDSLYPKSGVNPFVSARGGPPGRQPRPPQSASKSQAARIRTVVVLHLNAQTLGATGEANTLGASVGDLKTPGWRSPKPNPALLFAYPSGRRADQPTRQPLLWQRHRNRPTQAPFQSRITPTGRLASHHLTTGQQPAPNRSLTNALNPPTNRQRRRPQRRRPHRPAPPSGGQTRRPAPNAGPNRRRSLRRGRSASLLGNAAGGRPPRQLPRRRQNATISAASR